MVTLSRYWLDPTTGLDRRVLYASDFNSTIAANASDLVPRIERLLTFYRLDTGDRTTEFWWASGWRSPAINAATPNAAPKSNHMTGNAGDVGEPPSRPLATWLMTPAGQARLIECGLYMEHPSCTRGKTGQTPWVHLQRIAPGSKRRVYYPR